MTLPPMKENSNVQTLNEGCQDLTPVYSVEGTQPHLCLQVNLSTCTSELSGLSPSGHFQNKALSMTTSLYHSLSSLVFSGDSCLSRVATQVITVSWKAEGCFGLGQGQWGRKSVCDTTGCFQREKDRKTEGK